MRKQIFIPVLILAVLIISAFSFWYLDQSRTPQFRTFSDDYLSFSYPSSWIETGKQEGYVLSFNGKTVPSSMKFFYDNAIGYDPKTAVCSVYFCNSNGVAISISTMKTSDYDLPSDIQYFEDQSQEEVNIKGIQAQVFRGRLSEEPHSEQVLIVIPALNGQRYQIAIEKRVGDEAIDALIESLTPKSKT